MFYMGFMGVLSHTLYVVIYIFSVPYSMQKFTQQKGRWSQGKMTLINRRSSGVCDVFISPAAF